MREIISLHVGQAGVQLGDVCWEQYCAEHGLSKDGRLTATAASAHSPATAHPPGAFFYEASSGKHVPRAVVLDLDSMCIDQVRAGPHKALYRPADVLSGKEDTANLFARGFYTTGRAITEEAVERIRKQAESCDSLQGFVLYAALGGGTGSGVSCRLLQHLASSFGKACRAGVIIYPSPNFGSSIVEPYNCAMATSRFREDLDLAVAVDNEALYGLAHRWLQAPAPSYRGINQILAQAISTATASMRFDGTLNVDLQELRTNLVPFPKIHFVLPSYAPLAPAATTHHAATSAADITNAVFHTQSRLVDSGEPGVYFACSLMYRGDVVPGEIALALDDIKSRGHCQFVDWCPTGFKCGITYEPPRTTPDADLAHSQRAVCMLANNSSMSNLMSRIGHKFDTLYYRRAFAHWYVGEGLDESSEFAESRDSVRDMEVQYHELAAPELQPTDGVEDAW